MESIKTCVKEKINLMFERKEDDSSDGSSDSEEEEEDDDEEEQRQRIRYTNLAGRSMSHSLAPPARTCSPPPTILVRRSNNDSPPDQQQSTASRAFNFFRRKSDPRGTNQSRLRSEKQITHSDGQDQPTQLAVPLIVHRRRSSIAMTK